MKKVLLFLCAILVLLAFSSAVAADEEIYTEGYFYYTISDQSITIVGYFGNETVVTVPSSIAGIPVNAIGPGAFADTGVQKLYLPDTIRELGENATGIADVFFIGQTPTTTDAPQGTDASGQQGAVVTPAPEGTTTEGSLYGVGGVEPPEQDEPQSTPVPVTETQGPTMPAVEETASPNVTAEVTIEPTAITPTVEPRQTTEKPVKTEQPQPTPEPDEQPKKMTWVWIVLGGAAVTGGVAAAVKKGKKK